jgi:transmembrane sensor
MASQEAAYWFIRCMDEASMSRRDRQLFLAWLKESPLHVAEILRIVSMDGRFSRQRLLEVVQGLGDSNVVEVHFGGSAAQYDYQPSKSVSDKVKRKSDASPWRMAAAILLAVLLGFAMVGRPNGVVETVASEWQHKRLKDGSSIHLDARTRLKVEMTDGQRLIHLYSGQAAFDVAKDSRRPFIVRTPTVDVIAVGTRFSVNLNGGVTTTVEEGTVKVIKHGEDDASAVMVTHDEQLYVPPVSISEGRHISEQDKVHVNGASMLEWTTGWVHFDDGATVGEMVKQFNRRHATQATIEDPSLADKEVHYARMRINSVEDFRDAMESQRGVAVIEDRDHETLRLLPE